jgi:hypothetical protein
MYSTGSPGGKTGSPGDGGTTCTQCHSGTATAQDGWITSTIPVEGYEPGQTYSITATGTHDGVVKFGFELTAEDMNDDKTGTLMVTNASQNQLVNGNNSITHTAGGTAPSGNTKSWTFDWTAPVEGTGDVTFYGAFNAANGNGNNQGDVIYTSTLSVPEATVAQAGITVSLTGMTPHVGQLLEARLIDKSNHMEVERLAVDEIPAADFEISFANTEDGKSYWIDFYADHNDNGWYDGVPTDHAWRITVNDMMGPKTVSFAHNVNFSEINFKHMYKLEFKGMTPHIGQKLEVRLVEMTSMMEAGRVTVDAIPSEEFDVFLPFIATGETYYVDFYADHNSNGVYDAPPTDHAWRMELTDVEGDEDDEFIHNTNFTDIGWSYRLTLNATGMNPHLGQLFELRLVNQATLAEAGRMRLDSIVLADFAASAIGLELGEDYFVDFYADHNGNGMYDPPPTDHAWRLELNDVAGDSELDFAHNTNFTDIGWPLTGINESILAKQVQVYPNPVNDQFTLNIDTDAFGLEEMSIFSASGLLVNRAAVVSGSREMKVDISNLNRGIYYLTIQLDNGSMISKSIIKL